MAGCLGRDSDGRSMLLFSASKPMIAVTVLALADEGLLSLDDHISTHLGEFAGHGKETIRLRHALCHAAGMPSATLALDEVVDRDRRMARYQQWQLEWPPGSRFAYNGWLYHVLADAIETITGRDFRHLVADNITTPGLLLGGQRAAQTETADLVCVDRDGSTVNGFPGLPPVEILQSSGFRAAGIPSGGGLATAEAVASFYQELLAMRHHNSTLASATTIIDNPHIDQRFGLPANYGLGFAIAGHGPSYLRAIFGHTLQDDCFGHNGTGGQVCWADPSSGVSFAYLTNELDLDVNRAHARFQTASTAAADLAHSLSA